MTRSARPRQEWRCHASAIRAALAVIVLMAANPAAAATVFVDGMFGTDSSGCGSTTTIGACKTIQFAINKASAGDTVKVAAGLYPEPAPGPLTINKTLTLSGAQSGIDARTRVGSESVVTDPQGTAVAANNVVIDGFTFQDSTNNSFTGFGIWMGGESGTAILNNIIQNNIVGIGVSNPNGSQALIRHNVIRFNNQPGSASGTGIYSDQFVAGNAAVKNVLIDENTFVGNADAGIDFSQTDPVEDVSGLEISHNSFDGNGRAVLLFDTFNTSIHDNAITNSTLALSAAIRLFDNNRNVSIRNNDLSTGAGHAIRMSFLNLVGGPSSGVVINENNIGVVGPASFVGDGLLVEPGGHVGTVDAECNWWGSPTGPTNINNPGGTGEEVVGDADFTPWLIAPAPGGACGLTPGKVTGGGQIDSDPIFSPLGDLVSLPALIPSVADPTAQATFGFVAKCCAATGNLDYTDHAMDVRIKAQTVDALSISSPGASCPATPGSKHAQFVGTAAVIRSTGTTTETYRVDVDDCGEPGTADTFGIKTTTYSNGPSVLIGGNIQIHQ